MSAQATFLKNGPLKLEGEFHLLDAAGQPLKHPEGKTAFLCRCGHSANKPFCDGTHSKQGFQSEVKATP